MKLELGTLPEWFAAVGTVGATLLAIKLLGKEGEKEESRQASEVSAWLEFKGYNHGGDMSVSLHIRNGSSEPVYKVNVKAEGQETRILDLADVDVLPPGERQPEGKTVRSVSDSSGVHTKAPRVTISFTDAQSRNWKRDFDGVLSRVQT